MGLRRWVLLGLLAGLVLLLGWLQYRLWLGIGSAGEVAGAGGPRDQQTPGDGGVGGGEGAPAPEKSPPPGGGGERQDVPTRAPFGRPWPYRASM